MSLQQQTCPRFSEASVEQTQRNRERLGKGLRNAGELLDRMMKVVKLDRKAQSFTSNICHCRPPENRTPTPAEANFCRYIVENEIIIVRPKIIFAVGAFAAEQLLHCKVVMNQSGGKLFPLNIQGYETKLMPIYHPAYVLRLTGDQAATTKKVMGAWVREGLKLVPEIKQKG